MNKLFQTLSQLEEEQIEVFEAVMTELETSEVDLPGMISVAENIEGFQCGYNLMTLGDLGEFAKVNGMIKGLDDIPDEIYNCIDREKLGELYIKLYGGFFTKIGFIEPSDREWFENIKVGISHENEIVEVSDAHKLFPQTQSREQNHESTPSQAQAEQEISM
jgi:hypothetical protein